MKPRFILFNMRLTTKNNTVEKYAFSSLPTYHPIIQKTDINKDHLCLSSSSHTNLIRVKERKYVCNVE